MYVRANQSCVVGYNGQIMSVKEGDKFDADDPFVRDRPDLFASDEVEQATAAPGERRSTRRKS